MKTKYTENWFVAVWEGGKVVRVYDWDSWIRIEVTARDLDNRMVNAKDALEAFRKAEASDHDTNWIEWKVV